VWSLNQNDSSKTRKNMKCCHEFIHFKIFKIKKSFVLRNMSRYVKSNKDGVVTTRDCLERAADGRRLIHNGSLGGRSRTNSKLLFILNNFVVQIKPIYSTQLVTAMFKELIEHQILFR